MNGTNRAADPKQVFIADIRNCQTKEQERTRVDKENKTWGGGQM